jgi:hypothetical protein
MLHALHEIADSNQHDELRRLYPDEQGDSREKRGLDHVVEKVIAVIRP